MVHSLSGQEKPTTALATSDDGSLVVSAAEDNTCSVWEVATGRLVRVFEDVGKCLGDWKVFPPPSTLSLLAAHLFGLLNKRILYFERITLTIT